MTIEQWLERATRCLSQESRAIASREILEHLEEARNVALASGSVLTAAEALKAIGDPREANRLYRRTLLTSREARLLHQGNWEARAICSNSMLKRLLVLVPATALLAAVAMYLRGERATAEMLAVGSGTMAVVLLGPFLPIYTNPRAQIYRVVKWTAFLGLYVLLAVQFGWRQSWIFYCAIWPAVWIEWTRAAIRRKLPTAQWPKQLYL